jgi:beta-glucanase (GH16 family)
MKSGSGKFGATRGSRLVWLLLAGILPLVASCGLIKANANGSSSGDPSASNSSANDPAASDESPASTQATSTSPSSSRWVLTYDNEFNGTGVPQNWNFNVGGYGYGDNELQWNGVANARMNGSGQLVISATRGSNGHPCWNGPCQYVSSRIETLNTFSQAYGMFEARMKLPPGRGLWPAFWLAGARCAASGSMRCGEIDILEDNGLDPYVIKGYVHALNYVYTATHVLYQPYANSYHTYGVIWTPTSITWTLDGQAYATMKAYKGWPFNHPLYMILDLAVGGGYPGSPTAATHFPARMFVDWVRVYRQAAG